jgi:hypothetical protein
MKKLFLFAIVVFGFVASSFAQTGAGATLNNASASGAVLETLTIAQTTALDFGTIGATGSESTVKMGLGDSRAGSTATLFTGVAGRVAKTGVFSITGTAGNGFVVTLPSTDVILNGSVSGTMTIKSGTWITNLGVYPDFNTATIDAGGTYTLNVGATLTVGATQAAGVYTGTYTIKVDYN